MGFADLARPDVRDVLTRHRAVPGFRGIRQILSRDDDRPERSYAPAHHLRDPLWREQFALLAEMELSFDLQLLPMQMVEAARFLERHPDVPVELDHIGCPEVGHDDAWREGMAALAALPNLNAKLSGYGMAFGDDLGCHASEMTAEILALFGPARTMFGSNFPVGKPWLDYDRIVHTVLDACDDAAARDAVLHGTAAAFYRLRPAGPRPPRPTSRRGGGGVDLAFLRGAVVRRRVDICEPARPPRPNGDAPRGDLL